MAFAIHLVRLRMLWELVLPWQSFLKPLLMQSNSENKHLEHNDFNHTQIFGNSHSCLPTLRCQIPHYPNMNLGSKYNPVTLISYALVLSSSLFDAHKLSQIIVWILTCSTTHLRRKLLKFASEAISWHSRRTHAVYQIHYWSYSELHSGRICKPAPLNSVNNDIAWLISLLDEHIPSLTARSLEATL